LAVFHFDFDLAYQYIPKSLENSSFKLEIQFMKGILVGFRNI